MDGGIRDPVSVVLYKLMTALRKCYAGVRDLEPFDIPRFSGAHASGV